MQIRDDDGSLLRAVAPERTGEGCRVLYRTCAVRVKTHLLEGKTGVGHGDRGHSLATQAQRCPLLHSFEGSSPVGPKGSEMSCNGVRAA